MTALLQCLHQGGKTVAVFHMHQRRNFMLQQPVRRLCAQHGEGCRVGELHHARCLYNDANGRGLNKLTMLALAIFQRLPDTFPDQRHRDDFMRLPDEGGKNIR